MRKNGNSTCARYSIDSCSRLKASFVYICRSTFAQVAVKGFLGCCHISLLYHHASEVGTTNHLSACHPLHFLDSYIEAERLKLRDNSRVALIARAPQHGELI